ncbi:MAG: alpha/beta hydrolase family protein [Gemmatimonadales bacterium]
MAPSRQPGTIPWGTPSSSSDTARADGRRATALYLGGRSMGGRIASHLVAGGFPARGLIFLGYPLHSPRQPERMRDAHLVRIGVPMLFLQGTRDAFARPDLLARTLDRLPTATLHVLQGADHSLVVRGRRAEDVIAELADVAAAWLASRGGMPASPSGSRNHG